MKPAQVIAIQMLSDSLPGVRVSTRKPDPTPDSFVIVSRIGGGYNDWATRDPRFLVECYSNNEVEAERLAEAAHYAWSTARNSDILRAVADPNLTRHEDPDPKLFRFQFTGGLQIKLQTPIPLPPSDYPER